MNITQVPAQIREQRTTRTVAGSAMRETKIHATALITPITPGTHCSNVNIGTTMHTAAKNHAHIGVCLLALAADGSMAGLSFER